MQRAILNLIALYKEEPTLFDDFALPENIDKNNLLGRLIIECGELEVYLTRPDTMKTAIGFWSGSRIASWRKLADMITYEYNPIWNVDGDVHHEGSSESVGVNTGTSSEELTETDTVNREYTRDAENSSTINRDKTYNRDRDETNDLTNTHTDTQTDNQTNTHTDTRTDNLTETKNTSDDTTTTNSIAADNTEGFSNDTKSVTNEDITETTKNTGTQQNNGSYTNTGTQQTTGNYKNNGTIDETITDTETEQITENGTQDISDTEEETGTKTGTKTGSSSGRDEKTGSEEWHERRTGNIGVTMTQQLLEAEKALWSEYDVEGQIITEFKQEFLIMVY